MVLAVLLSVVALAGEPGPITLMGGGEFVASDPFLERRGLHLGAEVSLPARFTLDLTAGVYPNLGRGDHTALLRSLVNELGVTPKVSRTLWRTEFGGRWAPIENTLGALAVGAGVGLAHSQDDALGNPTVPSFDTYAEQTLATWRVGFDAEWRASPTAGVRVALTRLSRRETIEDRRSTRGDLWVSATFLWTPRRGDTEVERLEPSSAR